MSTEKVGNRNNGHKLKMLLSFNDEVVSQKELYLSSYRRSHIMTEYFMHTMRKYCSWIERELAFKQQILHFYTNDYPLKTCGFFKSPSEREEIPYSEKNKLDWLTKRTSKEDAVFKFNFLVDDAPVYEQHIRADIYDDFIIKNADVTNPKSHVKKEVLNDMNFNTFIYYILQHERSNLFEDAFSDLDALFCELGS